MKNSRILLLVVFSLLISSVFAQGNDRYILLQPARVFDGENMHAGWVVLVKNNIIEAAGPVNSITVPSGTQRIDLRNNTLMPGLIEGHAHLFLHPYNETSWDDQVLKESRAERTVRATKHALATLKAGFTTVRDLGTEGAMYDDVGLKQSIEKGLIPGPRLIISTRAIVAKGTYGPRPAIPEVTLPQGAAEVAGEEEMAREVRTQISGGADFIKVYADYRWGPDRTAMPTFTAEELQVAYKIASSGGRQLVAHASTPEGMKRATMAGAITIEHGDGGTAEVFRLMKQKGVALCPTLAAGESVEQYNGWKKGSDPEPVRITEKKKTFRLALEEGVTICFGGDVGVFTHGDNAREMELMTEYGMSPLNVLRSATSVNADVFGYASRLGRIRKGLLADIIAVEGDPLQNISNVRKVRLVMKDGVVFSQ